MVYPFEKLLKECLMPAYIPQYLKEKAFESLIFENELN